MLTQRPHVAFAALFVLLGSCATDSPRAVTPDTASLASPGERPNVVLIISDDQGWGDFGFMGSPDVRTPHLDALSAESLVYPRGSVPTALCRASLATLVTGLYPHQHKITGNDPPDGVDRERMLAHIEAARTVPELLGEAGYRSLQTGKWWEGECLCGGFTEGMSHGDPARGGRHGDEGLKIGRESMEPAFAFIDECVAAETPFYLWYAPLLPHTPHNPPERLLETYRDADTPLPVARYKAMCTWFDETCGALLEHLEQREIERDTLVVFVVDNGWTQREDRGGFAPRSKRSPYEAGVRTPILVRWLGRVDAERREQPVSSIDIAPTILRACGVDVPSDWPGLDLIDAPPAERPIFGAAFTHDQVTLDDPAQSLRTRWVLQDPFKLLVHTDPDRPTELYDVRADPHERTPLEEPAVRARLRADLDDWWAPESLPSGEGVQPSERTGG